MLIFLFLGALRRGSIKWHVPISIQLNVIIVVVFDAAASAAAAATQLSFLSLSSALLLRTKSETEKVI